LKVEEVSPEEIEDPLLRKIAIGEEEVGEQSRRRASKIKR
jgi:hypothetical protein